jgi:hypothetical protein
LGELLLEEVLLFLTLFLFLFFVFRFHVDVVCVLIFVKKNKLVCNGRPLVQTMIRKKNQFVLANND